MALTLIRPNPAAFQKLTDFYRECRRATDMGIVPEYFLALPDYVFSEKWEALFATTTHKAKLAIAGDDTAGFYIVGPMDDYSENFPEHTIPEKCGELHQLYLLPQYQKRGFGRKLYEDARKDLQDLGYESFVACTYLENKNAKSFYGAIGAKHLKDDVLAAPWNRSVTFFIDKT